MAHGLPDFNRGVDLAIQSLEKLDVDIVAQTLESLSIDLAAMTLEKIDIDIIAQTIGDLTINIAAQNLSEIINRPKYGAAQAANATFVATANATITVVSVSGKGIIYGGMLGSIGTPGTHGNIPIIRVDGVELTTASFWAANFYRMYKEHNYPLYLTRYDATDYDFSVGVSGGLTFESSFAMLYTENNGTTPSVTTRVIYALI